MQKPKLQKTELEFLKVKESEPLKNEYLREQLRINDDAL